MHDVFPQNRLIFTIPKGGQVEVAQAVVALFGRWRQVRWYDAEAGGVLLGRCLEGSGNHVIDGAGEPTPLDWRSRFRFERALESGQSTVDAAWERSSGTQIYLGEWHTHPEDVPCPSARDTENWRYISREARYYSDLLFFPIVGRKSMRLWCMERVTGGSLAECLSDNVSLDTFKPYSG